MNKFCLFTNDVESTSIWFNSLREKTAKKVLDEGLPLLLDIYEKYGIKTTFFVTGNIAKYLPDIVKKIVKDGHEIGSHGLSHEKNHGFDILSYKDQVYHLKESKKILEDISGQKVISFRSPALRMCNYTVAALQETGYRIDSSVASQRFDMFMSHGSKKKFKWLMSPRLPYRASEKSIFKKGKSNIVEVPLTAFILPYVGTTMRIFPNITNLQKYFFHYESCVNNKPLVFDIHPNELIDESNEPRKIKKNSNSYLSSLLKDTLRSKLKIKNLGKKALPLYESQIEFFLNKGYEFTTLKNFVKKQRLLT